MSDKNKPENKPEVTRETSGKPNGFGKDFFDAVLGQAITTYVRPAVTKIPLSVLQVMEKTGMDKILPILSVALSTVFSKNKYTWGDKFGDLIAELSAETVRVMNEKVGGKTKETVKTESGINANVVNQVLFGQELDEVASLVTAFSELYQVQGVERPEKEKGQINHLIAEMDASELYVFLKLSKDVREKHIATFVKKAKAEKTSKQAVKEFKKNIRAAVANLKMVHKELLAPAWENVKQKAKQAGQKAMTLADTGADKTADLIDERFNDPVKAWADKINKRHWLYRLVWPW